MAGLQGVLERYISDGSLPGAVGLVVCGGRIEAAVVGSMAVDGRPMTRDSIFRFASITKPITAAAVMMLIEDGRIALDDPVGPWLPELAEPKVVRTPESEVEDVVRASRPITVFDLLSSRAGYGFASDFTLPAVQRLFSVQKDGREQQGFPAPGVWMAELARIPLLYQPGQAWLHDTSSTLHGVLIARVSGQSASSARTRPACSTRWTPPAPGVSAGSPPPAASACTSGGPRLGGTRSSPCPPRSCRT